MLPPFRAGKEWVRKAVTKMLMEFAVCPGGIKFKMSEPGCIFIYGRIITDTCNSGIRCGWENFKHVGK